MPRASKHSRRRDAPSRLTLGPGHFANAMTLAWELNRSDAWSRRAQETRMPKAVLTIYHQRARYRYRIDGAQVPLPIKTGGAS